MVNECLRGNAIMFDPFRAETEWKRGIILTIETETMQEKRHKTDPASVTSNFAGNFDGPPTHF